MPVTYKPLNTTTLTTSSASVTFSSIPATYTDLVVVVNAGAVTNGVPGLQMQFNGDTGSNYSGTRVQGNGSSVGNTRNSGTQIECGNYDAGFPSFSNGGLTWVCNIQNYSSTTAYKTAIARYNSYIEVVGMIGMWRSTSAITSVTIKTPGNGDFASGSTFTLYGIAAA